MVNLDLIKKLIQIVKDENISGLAVEENGTKYEIRKEAGGIVQVQKEVAKDDKSPISSKNEKETEEEGLVAISSPMVGTFYRSPSPDSPAFVDIGDHTAHGKVVCIVEAMKLFNEIESEVSGKIVKILVENAKPVEYGQKLMLVKKG